MGEGTWLLEAEGSWAAIQALTDAAKQSDVDHAILLIEGTVAELTKPPAQPRTAQVAPLKM